jgi:hypothetical protein|tara:strand:+ start:870 stop:1073 length:204 start_codon:yes stop_codon:yes gene_type:complete
MIRKDTCDSCDRTIKNGEKVTVTVRSVEATSNSDGKMHVKLSEKSLGTEAFRVYCRNCLNPKEYFND